MISTRGSSVCAQTGVLRAATARASALRREGIAAYVGVSPDEIMVGCGSDEVMGCAFRALGEPGDRVAYMDPTFVMARVFAATNSLTPVAVPLTPRFDAEYYSEIVFVGEGEDTQPISTNSDPCSA